MGGILAGITPVWASEIEPFPVLVTHKRLPGMKHYGDVSGLKGSELEPVDIITFGSPCQDLSIAGKRAGIQEGQRSNLFFEAIRIVKEMREETDGRYPRYIVWENVPGAFSSNGGEDFRSVLEAVIGVKEEGVQVPAPDHNRWPKADLYLGDGWSVAYRVLDAQYWGVPNGGQESTLSQILLADVPRRYYLSPTACQGILRRASARGKELPEVLKKALERQAQGLTLEITEEESV